MPSASTKPENKTSAEAGDAMKQVLIVMDKKVRNLEKRKGKLDAYKEKANSGITLEKDQWAAVEKYGEVLQNLEFARELQKQFTSIHNEVEKFLKRQAKKEKMERQTLEVKRIREILKLQNLLDSLGSDKVRSDFQTGKHGAVVLTEDNLNQLDELYKLISPSRDGETNYTDQLTTASDHIVNLIEAKEKEVVGTTYKDLKEMIDMIGDCGYFENAPSEEEGVEESGERDFVVVDQSDAPHPDSVEVQASLPPEVTEQQQQLEQTNSAIHVTQQPELDTLTEADSFFSKSQPQQQTLENPPSQEMNPAYTRQRPFQEIVSEVQGNFNFLQESTIDMESPHMDPAVVAAHPMPPAPLGGPATSISSQTFTSSAFADLQPSQTIDNSQSSQPPSDPSLMSQQQSVSLTGQDYSSQEFTQQTFGQSSLTPALQSDSLFHQSSGIDSSSAPLGQSVMGQTLSDTTISQFEIPPQIPMPPSHEQSTQNEESQVEKKFQMNPNAQMFQSQRLQYQQDDNDYNQGQNQSQSEFSSYQGNNYNSGFRNNRGGGGFRGRGGRGGDRGGMSNGYSSRGGNRGGSDYRGGRGGSSYPPRQNYHRSDGYQGYNGNNSGGGFQKREGGMGRGGNRGSGGSRGGPPRGGNRGGFGSRPHPQQQVA